MNHDLNDLLKFSEIYMYNTPPKPTHSPEPGYEWVLNLMTQQWVQQAVDTPYCCRVDHEHYWSN